MNHPMLSGRSWLNLLVYDGKKFPHIQEILSNIDNVSTEEIQNMELKPIHKKSLLKFKDWLKTNDNPLVTIDGNLESDIESRITYSNIKDLIGDLYQSNVSTTIGGFVVEPGDYILIFPNGEVGIHHKIVRESLSNFDFSLVKKDVPRSYYMDIRNGNMNLNLEFVEHNNRSLAGLPVIDLTNNNTQKRGPSIPGVTFF